MAGWKKAAMVLGMGMSLISMPSAGAKEPPALPDTPDKIAAFLLKRNVGKTFPDRPDSPTYDIANRDIPDVIRPILTKRFSCLRSNATGNRNRGWSLYTDIFSMTFGHSGPSRYFDVDGRYIIGSDCRYHSCDEKGLTIFDKKQNAFVFAINHYIEWQPVEKVWAENFDIGIISIFVPPSYPPEELSGLTEIVDKWGKGAHAGFSPPIRVYAVDCSAGPGSAGRQ